MKPRTRVGPQKAVRRKAVSQKAARSAGGRKQKAVKRKAIRQKAVPAMTFVGSEDGYNYFRSSHKKKKR